VLLDEQNEKFKLTKNEMFKNPASKFWRNKRVQSLSEEEERFDIYS
jgi:hypothetical protein